MDDLAATRLAMQRAEDRRQFICIIAVIVGVVLVLVVLIGGIILNVRAGDAHKDQARLVCIQEGHTWIDDACIGGK